MNVDFSIFTWTVGIIISLIFSIVGFVKYRLDRNIKTIDDYREEFDIRIKALNERVLSNIKKTDDEIEARRQGQHKIDLSILSIQKDIEYIKATQIETLAMLKKLK